MMDVLKKLQKAGKTIYLLGCGLQYYKNLMPTSVEKLKFKKFTNLYFLAWNDFECITLQQLLDGYTSTEFGDFTFTKTPRAYTNANFGFEYLKIAE